MGRVQRPAGSYLQGVQYGMLVQRCQEAREGMGEEVVALELIPAGSWIGRYTGAHEAS